MSDCHSFDVDGAGWTGIHWLSTDCKDVLLHTRLRPQVHLRHCQATLWSGVISQDSIFGNLIARWRPNVECLAIDTINRMVVVAPTEGSIRFIRFDELMTPPPPPTPKLPSDHPSNFQTPPKRRRLQTHSLS